MKNSLQFSDLDEIMVIVFFRHFRKCRAKIIIIQIPQQIQPSAAIFVNSCFSFWLLLNNSISRPTEQMV